jgi:coenzyme F420-0:L-glutamate ligase/coenzyme F420-1:gamma-L-glutamate ligase
MTAMERLVLTALLDIPSVSPGDDITLIVETALDRSEIVLEPGDVIVITQKIVSKAEDRYVDLEKVIPSEYARCLADEVEKDPRLVEVILSESTDVVRKSTGILVTEHRLGFVLANAGVDSSNIDQSEGHSRVLLLPTDPDKICGEIRNRIETETGVCVGIIINDSHGRAWRNGTVGVALGSAGLPALLDLRGRPDIFGTDLKITQIGLADEIAAAASVLMGQGDEMRPVVHVRGVPYPLSTGKASDLLRNKQEDLFR